MPGLSNEVRSANTLAQRAFKSWPRPLKSTVCALCASPGTPFSGTSQRPSSSGSAPLLFWGRSKVGGDIARRGVAQLSSAECLVHEESARPGTTDQGVSLSSVARSSGSQPICATPWPRRSSGTLEKSARLSLGSSADGPAVWGCGQASISEAAAEIIAPLSPRGFFRGISRRCSAGAITGAPRSGSWHQVSQTTSRWCPTLLIFGGAGCLGRDQTPCAAAGHPGDQVLPCPGLPSGVPYHGKRGGQTASDSIGWLGG